MTLFLNRSMFFVASALNLIAIGCQQKGKSDSPSAPKTESPVPKKDAPAVAKTFGTGLLQASDIEPGSSFEQVDPNYIADSLLNSSTVYNHDNSGSSSASGSPEYDACEKKAWAGVQLKGTKEKLEITGTVDHSKCNMIGASANDQNSDITHYGIIFTCAGVDFSPLNGTSAFDFMNATNSAYDAKCAAAASRTILHQIKNERASKYSMATSASDDSVGPAMSVVSANGTSGTGASSVPAASVTSTKTNVAAENVTIESQTQTYSFEGKADGTPCQQTNIKGVVVREDGCISVDRVVYVKDLEDGKPSAFGLNGKENYTRFESSGLKGNANANAIWFQSGVLKFILSSWKGTISYSGDNVTPKFTATSGSQTKTGSLVMSSDPIDPSGKAATQNGNEVAEPVGTVSPFVDLTSNSALSLSGSTKAKGGFISGAILRGKQIHVKDKKSAHPTAH